MCHQFNIQQFYVVPTQCIFVLCVDLRTNSDYFSVQHSPMVFRTAARQQVSLHSLLISELGTSSQLHAPVSLPPTQKLYPLNKRLVAARSPSGRFKRWDNFLVLTDNRHPLIHPIAKGQITYTHSHWINGERGKRA